MLGEHSNDLHDGFRLTIQPKRLGLYKKYMYKNSILYAGVLDGLAVSLLRSVSGKEAVKAFIKAGGTARHGKGDHIMMLLKE